MRFRSIEFFERGDPVTYINLFGQTQPGKVERIFDDGSYLVRLTRNSIVRIDVDMQPGRLARRNQKH